MHMHPSTVVRVVVAMTRCFVRAIIRFIDGCYGPAVFGDADSVFSIHEPFGFCCTWRADAQKASHVPDLAGDRPCEVPEAL